MNELSIAIDRSEERAVVRLAGSAGSGSAKKLDRCVRELLVEHPAAVVIDVTGVTFIASTALALLAQLCRGLAAEGSRATITGASARIREVITNARLESILPLDEPSGATLESRRP